MNVRLDVRNMNQKVLVVNDLPGIGKVAGNINLPILAAAQVEAALLPTLLLSSYASGQGQVVRHFLEDDFQAMLGHWAEIEVPFALCLTGYFADSQQIQILQTDYEKRKAENPETLLVVDPIMGDLGKFYKGFDQEIADQMVKFIGSADVVMPNVTEACLMTGYPYRDDLSFTEIKEIAGELLKTGVQHVVITGAHAEVGDEIGFYLLSQNGESDLILHRHYDRRFYGTGDLAGSLVSGYLLKGMSVHDALIRTSRMMEKVLETTIERYQGSYDDRRLCFEPLLGELAQEMIALRKGE